MRSKMMVVATTAVLAVVTAVIPATGQRAEAIPAVDAVMTYRATFLSDTTPLDACSVVRELGADAAARVDPSHLDGPAEECPRVRPPGGSSVQLDSAAMRDGVLHVHLTVARGEYVHREDYTMRRWDSGEYRGVNEVRMWGAVQVRPVPPGRSGSR